MGERQNGEVKQYTGSSIFLYSHWGGGGPLARQLAEALDSKVGRGRWPDESYLARIIFCRMVKDDPMGETGYGIAATPPDENYPHLVVDCAAGTVDGVPFDVFIRATLGAKKAGSE